MWLKDKDPQMLKKYARVPPGKCPQRDGSNPSPKKPGPGNGKKRSNHVDSDNKRETKRTTVRPGLFGARFKIARAFSGKKRSNQSIVRRFGQQRETKRTTVRPCLFGGPLQDRARVFPAKGARDALSDFETGIRTADG